MTTWPNHGVVATEVATAVAAPAIEQLFARYADDVFRHALRFAAGDVAWAEDVTQEVFLGLIARPPKVTELDDLGGWFYRVTANRCLNQIRTDRAARSLLGGLFAWGRDRESPPTPATLTLLRSELSDVLCAMRRLPAEQRLTFCMHHVDGLAQKDIAAILGVSKGHVSRLIGRAEARLRKRWRVDDAR